MIKVRRKSCLIKKIQKALAEKPPDKNNTLIFGGALNEMNSIGMHVFVLN